MTWLVEQLWHQFHQSHHPKHVKSFVDQLKRARTSHGKRVATASWSTTQEPSNTPAIKFLEAETACKDKTAAIKIIAIKQINLVLVASIWTSKFWRPSHGDILESKLRKRLLHTVWRHWTNSISTYSVGSDTRSVSNHLSINQILYKL